MYGTKNEWRFAIAVFLTSPLLLGILIGWLIWG